MKKESGMIRDDQGDCIPPYPPRGNDFAFPFNIAEIENQSKLTEM
jgi:hypothetical protein